MKLDKILLVILALSFAISVFTLYQRVEVEKPYNRVELVADYDKYRDLGIDMGRDMGYILRTLKQAGVTSVAIKEETIEKLRESGLITALGLWEFEEQAMLKEGLSPIAERIRSTTLDPFGTVVVIARDQKAYDRVREPLRQRVRGFLDWSADGEYIMTMSGRYEELEKLALGFDYDKLEMAKELGFNIAARPYNYSGIASDYIEDVFNDLKEYPVTSLIFDGKQALGYPDRLETTARMVKETGIVLGPIETWMQLRHIDQAGLEQLIRLADYKAVRVFSLNEAEANKVSPKEVMDRWFRAVDERNLRLVYLNPKTEEFRSPEENFETNRYYIEQFAQLITDRGFLPGTVVPMKAFNIGSLRLLGLVAGIIAGALLVLMNLVEIRREYLYALFVLGMAGSAAVQRIAPSLVDKGFALGAAIVFPSLSMVYMAFFCKKAMEDERERGWRAVIGASAITLMSASAISLIGAAYVASILSSTSYLLELDIFRGVKVAHVVPLVVFIAAYFIAIGYRRDEHKGFKDELKALMDAPVPVKLALLLGVAAVGGYLYLGRTGHTTGAPIFGLEVRIRTFLEQTLAARPRTKEFLVAHPAMLLMVAGSIKKYRAAVLPLGLAGAIGQISMVNSFSHLRTPLYMSFFRTVYGLGFGIILGVAGIILLGTVIDVYTTRRRV